MKKILIISPDLSVKGGVSSVVKSLMTEMEKRGDKVRLYSSYIDSVHPILRVLYSLIRFFGFIARLHPFKYDVYYLHACAFGSFYRKFLYVMLLSILRKNVVLHQHAADLELFLNKNRFNKRLGKLAFKSSTKIFVLSEDMKRITATVTDNESIHIIENPIRLPEFSRADDRRPNEQIRLVFLGEIGKRKGIYDLIQALSRMTDEQKSTIHLDIGGNKELDTLTSMIRQYGLEKTCTVHGWVDGDKKSALLKEAAVYILPSYFEGVPISILEAMSYELPVISTNVAGIPEIVLHRYNGLIIEPGDIEGLKQSILYLAENLEITEQYGRNSRRLAEKHDVPIVVDKIMGLFENDARKSKVNNTRVSSAGKI
ncbi:glycosyltransferase family 4 protein [Cohnella panacarvi]|uniref:glycosyltransferase family 4 protein n=1 Tax=Cohnella panacarvi TaxID=400776 RepID=UPI000478A0F2|nr:glycosyltransferase family 4 protein [Cohnella panacarvi]